MTTVVAATPAARPTPPPRPAPAPPAPTPPALPTWNLKLSWDNSTLARDEFVRLTVADMPEGPQLRGFVSGIAWGRDTPLKKGDTVQGLIAGWFLDKVRSNQAGLAELRSNYPVDKGFRPGNGQFDLLIDRPGADADLRYVGLLTALPKPVADLLSAAREVREHF